MEKTAILKNHTETKDECLVWKNPGAFKWPASLYAFTLKHDTKDGDDILPRYMTKGMATSSIDFS